MKFLRKESTIKHWSETAIPKSNLFSNDNVATKRVPRSQKPLRKRTVSCWSHNIVDMVNDDVPDIVPPSDSSQSNSSSSTLTPLSSPPFDFNDQDFHKQYYDTCSISRPTTASQQGYATSATTAASSTTLYSSQQQQYEQSSFCVYPQKQLNKHHRRDRTTTRGMVGAGIGTFILPVIGMVGGYDTNQSLKRKEKKLQCKWERDQLQENAYVSQAARTGVLV